MTPSNAISLTFILLLGGSCALAAEKVTDQNAKASASAADTFFELKIRPVLMGKCFKCHGGDKVSSKLRIDSRDALIKGGDSGPAIAPGNPKASLLLQAISHRDEDLKMPPKKALAKQVVADFTAWIKNGAHWPAKTTGSAGIDKTSGRHWSFQPVADARPPKNKYGWSDHPIDRFIRAAQAAYEGGALKPVAQADRRSLIRRASFDLTGLPPTPQLVNAFVNDKSPQAFSRIVDQLLASPHYGERWGRHWLDLARYADTAGENSDYPIPEAYLYRDYVIDSFNADKPYDQFLVEQIAGDILARQNPDKNYAQKIIATGFIAQAKRFGTHKLEHMHLIIEDTLQTMGQVVLGLTLRCARCHDHKYEPITGQDYYALYGFFQSTGYPFPGGEEVKRPSEFVPIVPPAELARQDKDYQAKHAVEIKKIQQQIAKIKNESDEARRLKKLTADIDAANKESKIKGIDAQRGKQLKQQIADWTKQLKSTQGQLAKKTKPLQDKLAKIDRARPSKLVRLAYAVREGKAADANFQKGGNPRAKGPVVKRGVPKFLDPDPKLNIPRGASGRLQLARWLASPRNPLTARVMVNRIWQQHFGKPIVATPSDFGMQGEAPSHPELLDFLAKQFIDRGWSIKAMHRLIMSSKTYQLAVAHNADNAAKDAGNSMYWRFDRRRLDAESIRDSMLALGGNLDLKRPGPHPFPPKDKWKFTAHHQFKAVYPSKHRSVYLMVQRLHPHPYLSLFNGPDAGQSTAARDKSAVPLQSLFMLNSKFVHAQAAGLAAQLIKNTQDPQQRIKLAFEQVYARPATDPEIKSLLRFADMINNQLSAEKVAANKRELETWSSICRSLLTSNEFIYVN